MEKKNNAIAELNHKLIDINKGINEVKSSINMEGDVLEGQASILMEELQSVSRDLIDWKSIKKSRESLEHSLTDSQAHLDLAKEKLPEMEFIEAALSPKGIPLMIVDHYLPMIEARAQDILSSMSDGALKIKVVISDAGNRKGIELMAGTDQLRPAKSLSGGEQTRVSLAVRIAISQILAENSGCQFDCLIIDEPEYLDEKGIQQFVDAVISLQSRFSQIFVMSHVPQIRDVFPQSIMVTKQDNVSMAEVIA
jgi:exonuclease SbcC